MATVNLMLRLVNMLVTLYLSTLLYRVYGTTSRRFYLYWSLGYLFYGLNILVRMVTPESFEITFSNMFAFFLVMAAFVFMVVGVGELIEKTRLLLGSSILLILSPIVQVFAGQELIPYTMAFALIPYLFMATSLLIISWRSNVDLKLLTSGWWILFLANFGFLTSQIEVGFVDLISTVGKIIIYWGMIHPNFSFIVENLHSFMLGGIATEYMEDTQGKFTLVNLNNIHKEKDVQWIKDRVDENVAKGVRTIIVTMYDMIIPGDIIKSETVDELYFVRVVPGNRGLPNAFEEKIISINDDLNQLDILFSDVLKFSTETRVPCDIIVYTFSHLIHTHGWKRVYSFITSKNPLLKASMVELTGFYSPASHMDSSEIITFETIADRIIN